MAPGDLTGNPLSRVVAWPQQLSENEEEDTLKPLTLALRLPSPVPRDGTSKFGCWLGMEKPLGLFSLRTLEGQLCGFLA